MPLVDRAKEEIRKLEDILIETFQTEKKKEWTITATTTQKKKKPEQNTKNCGETSKLLTYALLECQEKRNRA